MPTSEEIREIYKPNYFSKDKYADSFSTLTEYQRRLNLMKKYIPEKSKVLDAGCATGDFVRFSASSYEMWGRDISEHAIAEAKQLSPQIAEHLSSGPLESASYENEMFDAIVLWDVIEHLWQPTDVIKLLNRILKPGGYLFLSTPNAGSLTFQLMKSKWAFMTPPEHLSFFSQQSLTFLLHNIANMKVLYWISKGKWTTFGFLTYKIGRIFKGWYVSFLKTVAAVGFAKIPLYIPTGDVAYMVARKN